MSEAAKAAERAALGEARDIGWPPTDDDAVRIAGAAGRAAGASACVSAGLGPAAPLCGAVAAKVSKFVTRKLIGTFVRRNDKAWRLYYSRQLQSETYADGRARAFELARAQGDALLALVDSMREFYREVTGREYPGNDNDVRRALMFVGAPMAEVPGQTAQDGKPLIRFSYSPFVAWETFFAKAEPLIATNAKGEPILSDATTARLVGQFWTKATAEQDAQIAQAGKAAAVLAASIAAENAPREGAGDGSGGGAVLALILLAVLAKARRR